MVEAYIINLLLFQIFIIPVIFLSALYYLVSFSTIFTRFSNNYKFNKLSDKDLPTISVQLPVYNDPVIVRCIKKCLNFNYPKNKYKIMVADDSTDKITKELIDNYVKKYPNRIKLFRRNNRNGFKPGALNNVLKHVNQEFIVIFDSDFVPQKNFLREIIKPFERKEVAIVQSNVKWLNYGYNFVSKFASTLLLTYHNCFMPLADKIGVAFLGGTGGAIRSSVLRKIGGWNEKSLTEDSDISIKILYKGYKSVFLKNLKIKGEVPFTLSSLVKQQTRWIYGNTNVIINNWKKIFLGNNFSLLQKGMITFPLATYFITPFIIATFITGNLGWFIVPAGPILLSDVVQLITNIALTSGFFLFGAIGLYRAKKIADFPSILISLLFLGLYLAITNFNAATNAILGKKLIWIRTPKMGSNSILILLKKFSYKKLFK